MARSKKVEIPYVSLKFSSDLYITGTQGEDSEPNDFAVLLAGTIEGDLTEGDESVEVGRWKVFRFLLGDAAEQGYSWFDVLDSVDADTANCASLIADPERNAWSETLEEMCDVHTETLLLLHRIEVDEQYRGKGFGLVTAYTLIQTFSDCMGVVVAQPHPLQYAGEKPDTPEFREAMEKVSSHWGLLGFVPYPNSPDLWVMSRANQQPAIEEVMASYQRRQRPKRSGGQDQGRRAKKRIGKISPNTKQHS